MPTRFLFAVNRIRRLWRWWWWDDCISWMTVLRTTIHHIYLGWWRCEYCKTSIAPSKRIRLFEKSSSRGIDGTVWSIVWEWWQDVASSEISNRFYPKLSMLYLGVGWVLARRYCRRYYRHPWHRLFKLGETERAWNVENFPSDIDFQLDLDRVYSGLVNTTTTASTV